MLKWSELQCSSLHALRTHSQKTTALKLKLKLKASQTLDSSL
jgi:hypothetical protein